MNRDFTLGNCLFGADKHGYSGYGIGFNSRSQFLSSDGSRYKYVVIFGVDNSSSVHVAKV